MNLTLLIDFIDSVYRIAVVDAEEVFYIDADDPQARFTLDSVYNARVLETTPHQVLWELSPGIVAISRIEKSFPRLTNGRWGKVQIVREGFVETFGSEIIHKPIEVSQNLTFVQESLIFQPFGQGWINRSGKSPHPTHQVQAEVWFEKIKSTSKPGLIVSGPTSLERLLRDQPWGPITAIQLATSDLVPYGRSACSSYAPHLVSSMMITIPKSSSLLADWGMEDVWHETLNPVIHGHQGGSLIIQTTAVATTIDVNAGSIKEDEANINICPLVAKQLIWRRLSGRVLIDFAGIQAHGEKRKRLVDLLQSKLTNDSPKWHVLGWSKSGLLELQRERRRISLEQLAGFHEMSPM